MNADEQAVRELHSAWIEAVNAGDLPRLLGWLADDAVLLNPGAPLVGRDAFAAQFTGALREIRFRCTSEVDEVLVSGDMACARCRDSVTVTPMSSDETTRFAGDRMAIYRRQRDGRWLLARDIHTLAPVVDTGGRS